MPSALSSKTRIATSPGPLSSQQSHNYAPITPNSSHRIMTSNYVPANGPKAPLVSQHFQTDRTTTFSHRRPQLVSDAAFANPFGENRAALNLKSSGLSRGAAPEEVIIRALLMNERESEAEWPCGH